MSHTDNDRFDGLKEEFLEHELLDWFGVEIGSVEEGYVRFEVPFDEKFANLASGTVHGGVMATMIDTASGVTLRTTVEDRDAVGLSTTDLDVRYIRPASADIRVEAEVIRAGESMGYTECEVTTVHNGERKVVATGGTSYRLFRE